MKRNGVSLLLTLWLALQACSVIPRVNDERPNFLIIITDDQRFDTMQYMPNTQKLIFDQGVTFSHGTSRLLFAAPAAPASSQDGMRTTIMSMS